MAWETKALGLTACLLSSGCEASFGSTALALLGLLVVGVMAWRFLRRPPAPEPELEELTGHLKDVLGVVARVWPSAEIDPQPPLLHVVRGSAELRLDLVEVLDVWLAAPSQDEATLGVLEVMCDAVLRATEPAAREELMASVQEAVRRRDTQATFETSPEGFIATYCGVTRTFLERSCLTEIIGLSGPDRGALLDQIVETRRAAASDPAEAPTAQLRLRFATPDRSTRRDALLQSITAQEGLSVANVVMPAARASSVEGLPFPLDFVVDAGAHIQAVNAGHPDFDGLSDGQLYERALENLRRISGDLMVPAAGVAIFREPGDHGAACVVLLPERLEPGAAVYVASPAPDTLILFSADDASVAKKALRRFQGASAAADAAPMPTPIRVTVDGFEPVTWATVTGA